MLTRKQLIKSARLMSQVGELRPGFLHDDEGNFEGPIRKKVGSSSRPKGTSRQVKISLSLGEDPITGEVRLRRK